MRIKEILSQHRRDFTATLVCEHCGAEQHLRTGYDDDNYHRNVIPSFACEKCGKKAPESHRPMVPKYAPWEVV
jgi:predicted HD phosphohydrolase